MTAPLHLGQSSALPASPAGAVLDYPPNPRPGRTYLVRFVAPEFTSLCPVTGQPDFAHLVIDYVPGDTRRPRGCGCLTRACRLIAGVGDSGAG